MERRVCTHDDFCKKVHIVLRGSSRLMNGLQPFSAKNAGIS
jgi:hypothetical protein